MKRENYSSSKSVIKLIANILSWTALAILIIIALFLLYLTISSKIYAKKGAAYEPKFSLYTIISPSMHPNLRVYDIIVDQRVDSPNDIQIGDVITFVSTSSISSNKTVTHRVIDIIIDEKGNHQYQTKGDNNLSPDSAYAEYNNILGKVLFKIPQLGRIQFFLASRGGWLVAIVIPALYIIVKDIFKIFKLTKINKKAETVIEDKKIEDDEKRKKRQAEEEERKRRLKEKMQKFSNDDSESQLSDSDNDVELNEVEENTEEIKSNDIKIEPTEYDIEASDFDSESDELDEKVKDNEITFNTIEKDAYNLDIQETKSNEKVLVDEEDNYTADYNVEQEENLEMPKLKTENNNFETEEKSKSDSSDSLEDEKRSADMYEKIFSHVPEEHNKYNQEDSKNSTQKNLNANHNHNHHNNKNSNKKKNKNKKHNHNKNHK